MKKLLLALVTSFFTVWANIAVSENLPFSTFKNWEITYRTEGGVPIECVGFLQYEGGMGILIGYSRFSNGDGVTLRLAHEAWKSIEEGKEYELTFKFPRRQPWLLSAEGYESGNGYGGVSINYIFDDSISEFISDFKKTRSVDIEVEGNQVGSFSLKGTMGMMNEVSRCFRMKVVERSKDPFDSSRNMSSDPFDL